MIIWLYYCYIPRPKLPCAWKWSKSLWWLVVGGWVGWWWVLKPILVFIFDQADKNNDIGKNLCFEYKYSLI